ncbi:MAG: polyphenol oxidase family protein [Oligoflexales bacterium]|nr:polyphenol oxidase family protein [Oligoflexales bacterium]
MDMGILHGFYREEQLHYEIEHPKQVHGTGICIPSEKTRWNNDINRVVSDAIFTDEKGRVIGVQTADCLPVLVYSRKGIMAIHGGWKGISKGIFQEAHVYLSGRGISNPELMIGIGPGICARCFEVGREVIDAVEGLPSVLSDAELALAFSKGLRDRWHVDLAVLAVLEWISLGVKPENIFVMQSCTLEDKGRWHSYRRDKDDAGRNFCFIKI